MIKRVTLTIIGAIALSGCGGTESSTDENKPIIKQPEVKAKGLSKFFNINIVKEEWNNGIYSGGDTWGDLGSGKVNTYYNPTMKNPIITIKESYYKEDNSKTDFLQKVEKRKGRAPYKDSLSWEVLNQKDDLIFVKTKYKKLSRDISEYIDHTEYMKFILKNKKLYLLSLVYKEKDLKSHPEVEKWIKIIKEVTPETVISQSESNIKLKCIIDGNTIIGQEGKTCIDNDGHTLTCNNTKPTVDSALSAGAGKSVTINGKKYSCQ